LEGGQWVLNGVKSLIGNVGPADLCIVAARTDPCGHRGISTFLLEKGTPGLRVGRIEEKMSVRGTVTGELVMEDATAPADALLGEVGDGFRNVMTSLDLTRLAAGAQAVGIAQAAYEEALRYSRERTTFGKHLAEHQAIAFKIADMATRIHAARLMLHHACVQFDAGRPHRQEAAMVKVFAAEMATFVTHAAQQIFGGWGIIKGNPVERLYRDARVTELYAGASEIQRMIISRHLLRQ
jgi:alkylation response protein AidB-like acyl-CoA dehydrogenase